MSRAYLYKHMYITTQFKNWRGAKYDFHMSFHMRLKHRPWTRDYGIGERINIVCRQIVLYTDLQYSRA